MKKNRHFLLFMLVILYATTIQSQTLEIHTINVGHGDAGLIIVRDTAKLSQEFINAGKRIPTNRAHMLKEAIDNKVKLTGSVLKSVLIDFGDSSADAAKLSSYLIKVGVGSNVDYGILSHNHKDHYGGFDYLVNNQFITFKEIYYRGNDKPKASSSFNRDFIKKIPSTCSLKVVNVNDTDLLLNQNTTNPNLNIRLTCIVNAGYVFTKNESSRCIGNSSQNDYGCGWILQYGGFRFFTAGDISGYNVNSYRDIETPLVDSIVVRDKATFTKLDGSALNKGHICCFKSSHHGSKNSSNNHFLSIITPQTCFISCGKKHGHPNIETIDRYNATITLKNTFLTNLSASYKDTTRVKIGTLGNKNYICGDIVCVVNDNNITADIKYTVFWNGQLDISVIGSSTKVSDMRPTSADGVAGAGIKDYNCHKVSAINYLTNHK
jgi:beta-lactamase superfamily II metal-dependent hydrolase